MFDFAIKLHSYVKAFTGVNKLFAMKINSQNN